MALPLKSGADLYNQQLIRAAIWNYSADGIDPREYSTGLMYFNTNPSSNMFQKLRFRTATEWKTIAFAEDLDVASNADFVALKEKVDLLSGDVDTDSIINNMKDVENFLAGFNESGGTLMNYLTTELGKKLDKTGGTIRGKITFVGNTYAEIKPHNATSTGGGWAVNGITFINENLATLARVGAHGNNNSLVYMYIGTQDYNGNNLRIGTNLLKWGESNIIHSGNVGDYALFKRHAQVLKSKDNLNDFKSGYYGWSNADIPINGIGSNTAMLAMQGPREHSDSFQLVFDYNEESMYFRCRIDETNWKPWKTIAFTDSNVAGAFALKHSTGVVGAEVDAKGHILAKKSIYNSTDNWYVGSIASALGAGGDGMMLYSYQAPLYFGNGGQARMLINSSGNVTIGSTDKASSHKLWVEGDTNVNGTLDVNGSIYLPNASVLSIKDASGTNTQILTYSSSNELHLGYGNRDKGSTSIWGKELQFKANSANALIINSSGVASFASRVNVGKVTDNSNYAMNVKGDTLFKGSSFSVTVKDGNLSSQIDAVSGGWARGYAILANEQVLGRFGFYGSGDALQYTYIGQASASPWMAIFPNGKVGIGTTSPSAQLHVKEDIVADGTIACKGIAEVGTTAAEGTVDKHAEVIEAGQQSYTINHQLHTKEITVCIYEMGGEETVLILTDVTVVSDDVIRVEFGRATDVKHRVVVMG